MHPKSVKFHRVFDRWNFTKSRYMRKHKKHVTKFFNNLEKKEIKSTIAEKIQKRLINSKNELFTFRKLFKVHFFSLGYADFGHNTCL